MKIKCEHEVMKKVTKDEDIIPMISIMPPAMLAFRFIMKCQDVVTMDHVLKADYNIKLLTPYVERYIREKEEYLGKRRVFFTKQEREETLREVEGLYKIFKEHKLVY